MTSRTARWLGFAIWSVVLVALSCVFFTIAARHLSYPGLYYDEALFYPASAKLSLSCEIEASVRYHIGCLPIVLQPPYIGALKSWLYAVIFSIVDPSMLTIRLPMILVQFASIIVLVATWAPRIGRFYALLLFAILCTDAIPIFHARVDWGPYALANFFKVAAICSAITWIESGRPRVLALLGLCLVLGVYDKLNFIWVVGSLGAALLLVYGRETFAALRSRGALAVLLVSAVAGLGVTVLLALPTMQGSFGPATLDIRSHASKIWSLLMLTLDEGPWLFVFREPWPGLRLASAVFVAGLAAGWALVFALPALRRRLGRSDPLAVTTAYAAFLTLIISFLFIAMAATKEASGPQHAIVVSLLWPLQVLLCGAAMAAAARRFLGAPLGVAVAPLAVAATLIVVHNLVAAVVYHRALDRGVTGNPNFSPALYKLVRFVDRHPGPIVVSVDWGTHTGLMALAKPETQQRFRNYWAVFSSIADGKWPPTVPAKLLGTEGKTLFILHGKAIPTFEKAVAGFDAAISPSCRRSPVEFRDRAGSVIYRVVKVANACLHRGLAGGT